MNCYLYKFSVRPLPEARRIFRAVTIAIIISSSVLISGFAYGIKTDIPLAPRMVGTGVITLILLHALQYYFWLAGTFKITEAGVHSKGFLSARKTFKWESICGIYRTTMLQGRSEHIEILVFCLDPSKRDFGKMMEYEQSTDFYFRRQKHYFVIMDSNEREAVLSDRGFHIELINAKKR